MKKATVEAPAKEPAFPLLGYRPDIDGLRAVAVLSVVGFHAFPQAVAGGFAGVDVFFVISGFLISNQILHRLERGDFTLSGFYARRIRRIFPALILVLAACYGLGWFALFAGEYAQLGKHIAAGATFLSNFVLWRESGYFDTSSRLKPLLHLWSLGVEEQFYLVWPLALILAFRLRLKVLALVITVLVASFVLNLFLMGTDASGAFYIPVTRFWELMAGAVLACQFSASRPVWTYKRGRTYQDWVSVAGLLLVVAAFATLRETMEYPGTWALMPVLGAVFVLAAGPDAWVNRHILAHRVLVPIGLISYPLYLWHWPLLSLADIVQTGAVSARDRFAIILLSFALATLTYLVVERPIRFGSKAPWVATVAAGLLAITGVAGWVTYEDGGAPLRAASRIGNFSSDATVPESTRTSDGSCRAVGVEQIGNEVCLSAGNHPAVLVVGDSHAMALNSAPFLGQFPVKTLLIAAHSCLPFLDYAIRLPDERGERKICTDVAWQMLGTSRAHPEIQNVVISTRGPIYFSGAAFGVEAEDASRNNWRIEPLEGAGIEREAGMATNPERFLRGFSQTISKLEEYGRTVTFVIDVPELGLDARTCIPGRPLAFIHRMVSPCTIPRTLVDQRQAEYRRLVKSLMGEHPRMRVFDPLPLFCDEGVCRGRDADHLLYFDSNHLSVCGSQRVWKALLPFILQGVR